MEEYIDRVDHNDHVIGITTKTESHAQGWHHRVVAVFVLRGNKLLVNERMDNGLFDHSVGGHVRQGESYQAAALREAREEIGLIQPVELRFIDHLLVSEIKDGHTMHHWFTVFAVAAPADFVPVAQAGEVKSLTYQDLDHIVSDMKVRPEYYTGGFKGTMKAFLQHK